MATRVQFRGGTTVEHAAFTGAAKEVTVDTVKKTVVVHDDNQAGGFPLLRAEGGAQDISTTGDISAADGTFTGAATFAGNVQSGGAPSGGTAAGVLASKDGYIHACRSDPSYTVWASYEQGTAALTSQILASGAATFGGVLQGDQRVVINGAGVKSGTAETLLNYAGDGSTVTTSLTADGAATFAGAISADGGIDFSGAQTNLTGMTSETLDAYEEGTFYAAAEDESGNAQSYYEEDGQYNKGYYTKIGNIVHFTIHLYTSGAGSTVGSEDVRITGLPFTSGNGGSGVSGGVQIPHMTGMASGDSCFATGYVPVGVAYILLQTVDSNGNNTPMTITQWSVPRGSITGWYSTPQ